MNDGWIKLHRKILDWEWYDDINVKVVFLHLLLTANHKDKKWRGIEIKRGQKLTSQQHLADATGLSRAQIRTVLDKLESTNEITNKTTHRYSLITINNYNDYQANNQLDNQVITKSSPSNNHKQEYKNVRKKEKIQEAQSLIEIFNHIWGTNYRSHRSWFNNFKKWREVYSLEDMKQAIENAKEDSWWKDKLDLDKLLRTHEDRIGQLLNRKANKKPDILAEENEDELVNLIEGGLSGS